MLKRLFITVLTTTVLASFCIIPVLAQSESVVHAVFFYSPTCPHCHEVMENVLPVLEKEYGDKLVIAQFDTTTPQGNALWQAAVSIYKPPVVGVPALVVGDNFMVGSRQIPDNLPGYIDQYLQIGGVDWPALPGMEAAVEDLDLSIRGSRPASIVERFTRDLAGNSLAVIVLIALLCTFFSVLKPRPWHAKFAQRLEPWGIFIVIIIGLTAASYLTYVETTQSEAFCGPIGDCNAVQQTEFALLFGFLPVALLGVIDYVTLLLMTIYEKWLQGPLFEYFPAFSFLLAVIGIFFSTYLTFLQPFVIGATCAWCLTSAVCTLLITLLRADSGWQALKKIATDWRKAR